MIEEAPDAPGLRRRKRGTGEAWYWVASAVSRRATDYPVKTVRLHQASAEERAARCRILSAELNEWLATGDAPAPFDGTVNGLIRFYSHTPESPYFGVQENTKRDYDDRLRVIGLAVGDRRIAALTAVDFRRWHTNFKAPVVTVDGDGKSIVGPERVRRAQRAITMVRMLFSFGKAMRLPGCRECVEVLEEMEFAGPRRRTEALTFQQADRIIDLAIAAGRRSIALGQALQFELAMRQVDVIGKWTKAGSDQGGIVYRGSRWGGGLLWSDITPQLMLSKVTTKTAATGEWDLTQFPLVMKAMAFYPAADRVGPVVVSEKTGIPYDLDYARDWRPFADAAGVPRNVWNRDSRAGGITEGFDAGGTVADLQHLATHSDPQTTQVYIRGSKASTTRIAQLRVAHRKQVRNAP